MLPPLLLSTLLRPPALRAILLLLRPQNLANNDGAHIHADDEQPHRNQGNRHDAPHILDRSIPTQGARNGERSSRQSRIREHKRVPRHGEVELAACRTRRVRADADEEEPEGQAPQPQAHEIRADHADAARPARRSRRP